MRVAGLEVAFGGEGDAGGGEGLPGGVDFGNEAAGTVAADGFADLGEGGAGGAFYVGDFGLGALEDGEVECGGSRNAGLSPAAFVLRSR